MNASSLLKLRPPIYNMYFHKSLRRLSVSPTSKKIRGGRDEIGGCKERRVHNLHNPMLAFIQNSGDKIVVTVHG